MLQNRYQLQFAMKTDSSDLINLDRVAGSEYPPLGGVNVKIRCGVRIYMHAKCVNKLSIRLELEETFLNS